MRHHTFTLKPTSQTPDNPELVVGRGTYGEPKIENYGHYAKVEIGSFCSIARGVTLLISGFHRTSNVTTFPLAHFLDDIRLQQKYAYNHTRGDLWIGSDVDIGIGATIHGGLTIGHGAVIGDMSVVTRNVEPYSIVAGNPARFRKWRFADSGDALGRAFAQFFDTARTESEDPMPTVCKRVLATKWWEWDDAKIREFLPLLMSDRVEKFLEKAEVRSCA